MEEIQEFRSLASSIISKSTKFTTDPEIFQTLRDNILKSWTSTDSLNNIEINLSPEGIGVSIIPAAKLVSGKSDQKVFDDVLRGAYLNLVGC